MDCETDINVYELEQHMKKAVKQAMKEIAAEEKNKREIWASKHTCYLCGKTIQLEDGWYYGENTEMYCRTCYNLKQYLDQQIHDYKFKSLFTLGILVIISLMLTIMGAII